jgi:hypothetical protein
MLAGTCLTLLPLCGANGLALVPALVLWLVGAGISQWRAGTSRSKRSALIVLASVLPALLLLTVYHWGYHGSPAPNWRGEPAMAKTALQFLSLAFGPPVARLWPYSGWAVAGLLALSVAILFGVLLREPRERPRAWGLLCFLAAMGSLALGLGWGRAGTIPGAGFADRYVILAVPSLCAVSLCWQIYGGPVFSRLVPMGLFVAMCVLLWPNSQAGLVHGRIVRAEALAFQRDLLAGLPSYKLVKRYTSLLHPSQDELQAHLSALRRHGVGQFGALQENPAFQEISIPPKPDALDQALWENGTAKTTGSDAHLLFDLPDTRYVAGIRLRYSHANRQGTPAHFQLSWRRDDRTAFGPDRRYAIWFQPTGPDRTTTIWIDDTVKQIRIQPDNQPTEFRIAELTLLVPSP